MKKMTPVLRLVACLLPLSVVGTAYAQQSLTAVYTYEHRKVGFQEDYTLHYKDGVSHYQHPHAHAKIVSEEGWEFYFPHDYYHWYHDQLSKRAIEYRTLEDGTVLTAQWQADIKWKITDEHQTINGYKAQKAIALSHNTEGRGEWDTGETIAWFAPEIPIASGPERYHGLPGLIVKIEFSKRSMTCTLKSLAFEMAQPLAFPETIKGGLVTREETFMPGKIDKRWLKAQRKLQASGE